MDDNNIVTLFKFDHTKQPIGEACGLDHDVMLGVLNSFRGTQMNDKPSESIEAVVNKIKAEKLPMEYAVLVAYLLGRIEEKLIQKNTNPIAMIMGMLSEDKGKCNCDDCQDEHKD